MTESNQTQLSQKPQQPATQNQSPSQKPDENPSQNPSEKQEPIFKTMEEADNYLSDFVQKVLGIKPDPKQHSIEQFHYMVAVSVYAVNQAIQKEGMKILNYADKDKKKIIT